MLAHKIEHSCAARLDNGWSRIYQYRLLGNMKATVRRKAHLLCNQIDVVRLLKSGTFRTFDNLGTPPVHGFQDGGDYYTRTSCQPFLRTISTPVLILQAEDDPLMRSQSIPTAGDLGPGVTLEVSSHGGHVACCQACQGAG